MARSATEYARRIAAMLPQGRIAWLSIDTRVGNFLRGLGRTGNGLETAVVVPFERDCVPSRCEGDALAAWETALSLPDLDRPAVDPDVVADRQAEVARALGDGGNPTTDRLIALAALWGVTVTITEPFTTNPCEIWINGPAEHVTTFRAGSHAGDHVGTETATWASIRRLIGRYVQAHIRAHFVGPSA